MITRDEIIRMAREAGSIDSEDVIETVWAAFAAAEREACAKVCDFEVVRLHAIDEPRPALAVGICATAIRARGEK